ncbi:MAG: hypothetical protein ACXWV4_03405 [Flavitalea sp.]
MQDRIGEKKNKPNYWYLAAASILIVLVAGIFIITQPKPGSDSAGLKPGNQNTFISKGETTSINKVMINQQIENKIAPVVISKNKNQGKNDLKIPIKEKSTSQSTQEIEPGPIQVFSNTSAPDVLNNISTEVPENHTATVFQPLKKKLKVLHHNHLDKTNPVSFPEMTAASKEIPGSISLSKHNRDDVIRIKITTTN